MGGCAPHGDMVRLHTDEIPSRGTLDARHGGVRALVTDVRCITLREVMHLGILVSYACKESPSDDHYAAWSACLASSPV